MFKIENLSRLIFANMISSIGTGITMIALPWYIINRQDGDELYGYLMILVTMITFFLSPYIGVFIDRSSRKKILLLLEGFSFLITGSLSMICFFTGNVFLWPLILLYITGSVYYSFFYQTRFAFVQESFRKIDYKRVNNILEVQGQVTILIIGGVAAIFLEKLSLYQILAIDAGSYFFGYLLFLRFPYKTHKKSTSSEHRKSVIRDMSNGIQFMKVRPLLIVFLISSLTPFLISLIANYIYPVYVVKELKENVSVLGIVSICSAIGSILAGLIISSISRKISNIKILILSMSLIPILFMSIMLANQTIVFLISITIIGWLTICISAARNTVMMENIPSEIIGRVNGFLTALGTLLRLFMLGAFVWVNSNIGVVYSFLGVSIILTIALIGLFVSRHEVEEDSKILLLKKNK